MIEIDGDSIAEGIGASTPARRWYELIRPVNYAVSSSQVADVSGRQRTISAENEYFLGVGGNDAARYKNDPIKQEYFRRCLRACLAWRLLVDRKTARGVQAGITFTGTWTDSPSPNTCGKYTTQNGAMGSATVSGDTVYIGVSEGDYPDMAEAINVVIDGVNKGNFSVKRPGVTTFLGQWWGRITWRFTGLGAGNHSVIVKHVSPTGKFLHLDYIAGSDQTSAPRCLVGNCVKFTPAYMADLGITTATIQAYNQIIADVVAEFTAHGMDVQIVDRYSSIDQSIHASDYWGHPNDAGQVVLHDLFMNVLQRNA